MLPGQWFDQNLGLGCFRIGIGLENGYSEKQWFGAQLLVYYTERRNEGRTLVQHAAGVRGRHLEFWASRGREKGMVIMCRMFNFGGIRLFCN